jgi:acid phosphatase class B
MAPIYTSPESVLENCRPITEACDRVRAFIEAGQPVHFITGRSGLVKAATVAQLRAWIHWSIQPSQVHVNGVWAGYAAMQAHKAERLRELGALLYVGDHAADEAAAMDAGIPFLHADAFAAGEPLPVVNQALVMLR